MPELAGTLAGLRTVLPGPLRRAGDRSIPPALRSVLAKCLAPDPLDRYGRGSELAEDLDRWRSDRPLAFAEEPRRSALTRGARRRRAPLIAGGATLVTAVAVAVGAWFVLMGSRRDQALAKYAMITSQADSGAFAFRRFGQWRDDLIGDPSEASARQLARYNALADPDWEARDDVRSLPDRERGELTAWLFEQVLRHASALGRRPDSPEDWRRGLGLLERTLARASSAPLQAERLGLRDRLKLPRPEAAPADRPGLPAWMDDYLAGVAAEPLHAREALGHYLDALRRRPDMFWARYRAAVVAVRVGEFGVAVEQLLGCVGRSPENPALRLQLATSLYIAGRDIPNPHEVRPFADALAECNRAVELDPDYAPAYLCRARILQAAGQVDGLRRDFDRYAWLTRVRGTAPAMILNLGLNYHPGSNYARIPVDVGSLARKILEQDPRDCETRVGLAADLASSGRPAEAVAELDRVLDADPDHLRARYHRAIQLKRVDPEGALAEFAAVARHPRFEELLAEQPTAIRAFHYAATDLLKRGRLAEALDLADASLVHANRSRSLANETIQARRKANNQVEFSPRGESHYLIARIHAAAAETDPDRIGPLIENLGQSFAKGAKFRDQWFPNDRRFDGLRDEIAGRLGEAGAGR